MQRVTPGIGKTFVPVEEALRETFLSSVFQGLVEGAQGRGVTCLTVKQAGMALPYKRRKPLITGRRPVGIIACFLDRKQAISLL